MIPADTALGERFALARARLRGWRHRVTGWGLALRATMLVAGLVAIGLSTWPNPLGVAVAVLLSLAALPRPGSGWSWPVPLAAVGCWTLTTLSVEPSLPLAFGVGAAVYVHHAAASLAAIVRTDAAVDGAVTRDWVRRLATVLAVSAVAAAVTAILSGRPLPLSAEALAVLASLGALAVPVAIVAILSRR